MIDGLKRMAGSHLAVGAEALLREMVGPRATFRDGQLEAILETVEHRGRTLLVQRTGWGKSLVYFIASRLLRDQGSGPTLLVSPLLSLMRNQIEAAERIGVRAARIDSENAKDWHTVERRLEADEIDVLLVSPERLANERFLTTTLPSIRQGIGLLVVDEAHCISDWGHDFRPDYRRIVRIAQGLPATVPLLATTATANNRVTADVAAQLGAGLSIVRGPLMRDSLKLQAIRLTSQAERLAWLAEHLPQLPGSGIIYCLTVADCERVSAWLGKNGVDAPAYHAQLPDSQPREVLEQRLLRNEVKALVATVALGMGFDKPDLGFVVHFQRPGSLVAYYQQIGRAGRATPEAYAILLNGVEDDEIQDYFIRSAFPGAQDLLRVLEAVEAVESASLDDLQRSINMRRLRLQQCLKLLEVDQALRRTGARYYRTANAWRPDEQRSARVTEERRRELTEMQAFVASRTCLMEQVARSLDDDTAKACGRCEPCRGALLSGTVNPDLVRQASEFLSRAFQRIQPRLKWAAVPALNRGGAIAAHLRVREGSALAVWGDPGWGRLAARGKTAGGRFDDALVDACVEMIRDVWRPEPAPSWVTAVPSFRYPVLVPDFAGRLASALGLPFAAALRKVREAPEQRTMENSPQQMANIAGAFEALPDLVAAGPVLLVDDLVDSRWTLTECGVVLRQAGSGPVYPLALASASLSGDAR